jgi:DNA-binding NtrC family response regulator
MVGNSTVMSGIRDQIARVAGTDANVLITGESGTGKEMVAELIHQNGRRRSSPFVAVNCAAIPDSLLESELFGHERGAFTGAATTRDGKLQHAAGGTLFLDEVGDMSLVSQAKILRAIENRVIQRLGSNVDMSVRFRVVAATNQNLEELTREKKFRRDLYFRLNVVNLELPPLRERVEDIPELSEHILHGLSQEQNEPVRRLGGDLIRRLQSHSWPGNVRELRNVLESILVYSSSRSIALSDLPVQIRKILGTAKSSPDERSSIISALRSADWNRNRAAKILHCTRMTLYRKMVKYSITDSQE